MKRLTLILGAAAAVALATPYSARAQGCSWWDLSCNGLASRVSDTGWHAAGRDQNGNVIYVRRRVDSNGNVVIEQARRSNFGSYQLLNTHTIANRTLYGPNGEPCKYHSNKNGYKEQCKYSKANKVKHRDSQYRPATYGIPTYTPPAYHAPKYKAPKAIRYDNDVKGPKGHEVDFHAEMAHGAKGHEGKSKGPKH